MPLVDLVMPKMGESIMEATILKWLKQPGDAVKQDESLLEIATDKVDSEVPSTAEGVLEEVLFQTNDVVPVGSVIARIRTGAMAGNSPAAPVTEPPVARKEPVVRPEPAAVVTQTTPKTNGHPAADVIPANRFYSPLVLNIAASEGVALHELENIPGSGNEGRVTKKDILQYVEGRRTGKPIQSPPKVTSAPQTYTPVAAPNPIIGTTTSTVTPLPSGNVEIMEMDRMRRLIADHMVHSVHTSPHVTSFTEADVTNLVHWRDKVKKEFEKREGTKLTFTPLFIEAIVHCIKKYPLVNSSVDGTRIIIKKDINIGMATALPSGNLIVPVIRQADQLNLTGLARQVNALAENARQNKLRPEDTQGGTFTMTNVGTFGSLMGTPIINQPQVAILAVGAIKKRPVVLETPDGDAIGIRHMMYLSLSYDHRIVDGSLGATFLTAVANELERFPPDREL
ncbi:MAG: 2-oxo acid dehydrogenase subunit E2 [Chitinophagaceae bacterium]|nr:2-oxo acid dehydrogenase subunit E2 [Chitinophagaceae bacterium]